MAVQLARFAIAKAEELARLDGELQALASQAFLHVRGVPPSRVTVYSAVPESIRDAVRAALGAGLFPDLPSDSVDSTRQTEAGQFDSTCRPYNAGFDTDEFPLRRKKARCQEPSAPPVKTTAPPEGVRVAEELPLSELPIDSLLRLISGLDPELPFESCSHSGSLPIARAAHPHTAGRGVHAGSRERRPVEESGATRCISQQAAGNASAPHVTEEDGATQVGSVQPVLDAGDGYVTRVQGEKNTCEYAGALSPQECDAQQVWRMDAERHKQHPEQRLQHLQHQKQLLDSQQRGQATGVGLEQASGSVAGDGGQQQQPKDAISSELRVPQGRKRAPLWLYQMLPSRSRLKTEQSDSLPPERPAGGKRGRRRGTASGKATVCTPVPIGAGAVQVTAADEVCAQPAQKATAPKNGETSRQQELGVSGHGVLGARPGHMMEEALASPSSTPDAKVPSEPVARQERQVLEQAELQPERGDAMLQSDFGQPATVPACAGEPDGCHAQCNSGGAVKISGAERTDALGGAGAADPGWRPDAGDAAETAAEPAANAPPAPELRAPEKKVQNREAEQCSVLYEVPAALEQQQQPEVLEQPGAVLAPMGRVITKCSVKESAKGRRKSGCSGSRSVAAAEAMPAQDASPRAPADAAPKHKRRRVKGAQMRPPRAAEGRAADAAAAAGAGIAGDSGRAGTRKPWVVRSDAPQDADLQSQRPPAGLPEAPQLGPVQQQNAGDPATPLPQESAYLVGRGGGTAEREEELGQAYDRGAAEEPPAIAGDAPGVSVCPPSPAPASEPVCRANVAAGDADALVVEEGLHEDDAAVPPPCAPPTSLVPEVFVVASQHVVKAAEGTALGPGDADMAPVGDASSGCGGEGEGVGEAVPAATPPLASGLAAEESLAVPVGLAGKRSYSSQNAEVEMDRVSDDEQPAVSPQSGLDDEPLAKRTARRRRVVACHAACGIERSTAAAGPPVSERAAAVEPPSTVAADALATAVVAATVDLPSSVPVSAAPDTGDVPVPLSTQPSVTAATGPHATAPAQVDCTAIKEEDYSSMDAFKQPGVAAASKGVPPAAAAGEAEPEEFSLSADTPVPGRPADCPGAASPGTADAVAAEATGTTQEGASVGQQPEPDSNPVLFPRPQKRPQKCSRACPARPAVPMRAPPPAAAGAVAPAATAAAAAAAPVPGEPAPKPERRYKPVAPARRPHPKPANDLPSTHAELAAVVAAWMSGQGPGGSASSDGTAPAHAANSNGGGIGPTWADGAEASMAPAVVAAMPAAAAAGSTGEDGAAASPPPAAAPHAARQPSLASVDVMSSTDKAEVAEVRKEVPPQSMGSIPTRARTPDRELEVGVTCAAERGQEEVDPTVVDAVGATATAAAAAPRGASPPAPKGAGAAAASNSLEPAGGSDFGEYAPPRPNAADTATSPVRPPGSEADAPGSGGTAGAFAAAAAAAVGVPAELDSARGQQGHSIAAEGLRADEDGELSRRNSSGCGSGSLGPECADADGDGSGNEGAAGSRGPARAHSAGHSPDGSGSGDGGGSEDDGTPAPEAQDPTQEPLGMSAVEREEWQRRQAEIERQRAEAAAEREAARRARMAAGATAELERRIKQRLADHHLLASAAAAEAAAKEDIRARVRANLQERFRKALDEQNLTRMLRQLDVIPKGTSLRGAEARSKALKAAKIRFHPDKVTGSLEDRVYAEEVSKLLNSWTWTK